MTHAKIHMLALIAVALAVAGLLAMGIQLLAAPKIFMAAMPLFAYEGPALIILAVALAWFREWAAQALLWLFMEMHRLISALMMAVALGAEGFMHTFNIPHIEGWWIPLIGGGAAATANVWLRKWKKKHPPTAHHG